MLSALVMFIMFDVFAIQCDVRLACTVVKNNGSLFELCEFG